MSTGRYLRWSRVLPAVLVVAVALVFFDQVIMSRHDSTTLIWTRPVAAESDVPISDIAGYTIHCWGQGGSHTHTIHLDDPDTTHFEIDGLPPGRYQCAVSAFTEDGIESDLSGFVARTVK